MKPVIFHMRASNFFGGPERQILRHIETSRNYRHVLITFSEDNSQDGLTQRAMDAGVEVNVIQTSFAFDPSAIFSMRRLFIKYRPIVICSHGYKPTIISLAAKMGLAIPLIVFSRGHTAENLKVRLYEKLEMTAMRLADRIVSVSNGYRNYLVKKGLPENKIKVVQNAINAPKMNPGDHEIINKRQSLGFSQTDFLLATAGRLSPEKAQRNLVIAFEKIQPNHPDTHLLIIGDGPLLGELNGLVEDRSIKQVHFLGFRKDMDQIMSAIDLFVLPSLTEGLPNVVLEAFAAKIPVVATRVGGVPEIVTNNISGFLCEPGDPENLAEALDRALMKRENLHLMGQAGYKTVQKTFSVESQKKNLESIYQDLICNKIHAV